MPLALKTKNSIMANTQMKSKSLVQMKDKYIGKVGTSGRDQYEYELRMDVLGRMINPDVKYYVDQHLFYTEKIGTGRYNTI